MDTGSRRTTMWTELVRGESLRQLRWQRQVWVQTLSAHAPGTPPLIAPGAPAELDAALDLLRRAGEEISPGLSCRGSFVRHRGAAGSASGGDSLAGLVAAIDGVLTQCDGQASGGPSMQPAITD